MQASWVDTVTLDDIKEEAKVVEEEEEGGKTEGKTEEKTEGKDKDGNAAAATAAPAATATTTTTTTAAAASAASGGGGGVSFRDTTGDKAGGKEGVKDGGTPRTRARSVAAMNRRMEFVAQRKRAGSVRLVSGLGTLY